LKDEQVRKNLELFRAALIEDAHYAPSIILALDAVLDPENGIIAAKQAGWALAHERANAMQQLATENELLKLKIAKLEGKK
jgi:hypothetical protein